MELRESILEGTLKAFNQKGLKFTMDDLAGILGMSKKTIYTVFRDKESLFLAMVDYLFDSIKESERQVLENEKLSKHLQTCGGTVRNRLGDNDFLIRAGNERGRDPAG